MKKKPIFTTKASKMAVTCVPLAVALTMFGGGQAFAAEKYVEVDTGSKIVRFDVEYMNTNPDYANSVQQALQSAFNNGRRVYIDDDTAGWIDFGTNAHEGVTYDKMVQNESKYSATPAISDYDLVWLDADGKQRTTSY